MISLAKIISTEIQQRGPMPVARFMELALYHPELGYYERAPERVGRKGDFFTSVSVGSLFGELLGFQFVKWGRESTGKTFQLVEAGAHDGRLAADILNYIRDWQPDMLARLEYWIVEPSVQRRAWQETRLREHQKIFHWISSLDALPPAGINGVIFANELLDAMPLSRLGWDVPTRSWFEWGVGENDARFVWVKMSPSPSVQNLPPRLPEDLLAVLPDGFTIEICPLARNWWQTAVSRLNHGHLLTFDYGFSEEQFFLPGRAAGTLRAYRQHHAASDVLADPGEQDLTAHVNFTPLQTAGEAVGLKTTAFVSQAKFLTEIARQTWRAGAPFAAWSPARVRQFQSLTHPDHLGRAFQVLVQSK